MKVPREAIWLILLAAILMLLITKGLGETPRRYEKRVHRRLWSVEARLVELDRHTVISDPTAMYKLRADLDMDLGWNELYKLQHGKTDRSEMDRLLKQLDRDMEDYPPSACYPIGEVRLGKGGSSEICVKQAKR